MLEELCRRDSTANSLEESKEFRRDLIQLQKQVLEETSIFCTVAVTERYLQYYKSQKVKVEFVVKEPGQQVPVHFLGWDE